MSSVFLRHPLKDLPRFRDLDAYFESGHARQGEEVFPCSGAWNTGADLREEEGVVFHLSVKSKELLAVRHPLGVGPRLPVVLIARGIDMDIIESAGERAKDRSEITTPDNVNNLDWLLTWAYVGRGLGSPRPRRPYIEHPRQILYG